MPQLYCLPPSWASLPPPGDTAAGTHAACRLATTWSSRPASLSQKFFPTTADTFTKLAKELGVYPDGLPTEYAFFLVGDGAPPARVHVHSYELCPPGGGGGGVPEAGSLREHAVVVMVSRSVSVCCLSLFPKLPLETPQLQRAVKLCRRPLPTDYLTRAAQLLGGKNITTTDDVVRYFTKNDTAGGLLRHSLVFSTIPDGKFSHDDLIYIGLNGIESGLAGKDLRFNLTGTRVSADCRGCRVPHSAT